MPIKKKVKIRLSFVGKVETTITVGTQLKVSVRAHKNVGVIWIRFRIEGRGEEEVLTTLHLQIEELPGEARRHYLRSLQRLGEASRRDWVFDTEARERALWTTRAQYLMEMM